MASTHVTPAEIGRARERLAAEGSEREDLRRWLHLLREPSRSFAGAYRRDPRRPAAFASIGGRPGTKAWTREARERALDRLVEINARQDKACEALRLVAGRSYAAEPDAVHDRLNAELRPPFHGDTRVSLSITRIDGRLALRVALKTWHAGQPEYDQYMSAIAPVLHKMFPVVRLLPGCAFEASGAGFGTIEEAARAVRSYAAGADLGASSDGPVAGHPRPSWLGFTRAGRPDARFWARVERDARARGYDLADEARIAAVAREHEEMLDG